MKNECLQRDTDELSGKIDKSNPITPTWEKTPNSGALIKVIKQGRVATIQADVSFPTATSTNTVIVSNISGCAPMNTIPIALTTRDLTGKAYDLIIGASGEVKISSASTVNIPANTRILISGSWITST